MGSRGCIGRGPDGGAGSPPVPSTAARLGHHEDGRAAHEEVVGHGLAHSRQSELIEDR